MPASTTKLEIAIQSFSTNDSKPIGHNATSRPSFAFGMQGAADALSIVASLSLLGWTMLRCQSGFETTDEGFYLNWISNPWNYRASVSQFGFVYHPLYKLVGGDLVLLRQANVLILFVLAWVLSVALLRSIFAQWGCVDDSKCVGPIGIALVAAAGSLSFLEIWLPTPSYNSLTFQALMLTAIGALLAERQLSKSSLAGWILIGIGGGLTFLAKPTSAAMLGCMVFFYLMAAGRFRLRGPSISAVVAILFLVGAALAIDGSPLGFARRMAEGLEISNRLLAGHSAAGIFRWDGIAFRGQQKFLLFVLFIVALVTPILAFFRNGLTRSAAALIGVVTSALVIATTAGLLSPPISQEPFQPAQFLAVAFGIALAGIIFLLRANLRLSPRSLALIALFAMMPYAYAFGTNTNYATTAARAGVFWFLAGFAICANFAAANGAWRRLIPVAAVALVVPTGVLYSSMENPYRQTQPLRLQLDVVDIPGPARLFLPGETAAYIRRLQEISAANGLRVGDPMLDLTGSSPGSLYVMGARSPGVAWMPGGYPGSTDFLRSVLANEACEEIAALWILTEPSAPERFSVDMLREFGIDITTDFVDVGSIGSTRAFSPQKFEHRLLKPARNLAVARQACEDARRVSRPR